MSSLYLLPFGRQSLDNIMSTALSCSQFLLNNKRMEKLFSFISTNPIQLLSTCNRKFIHFASIGVLSSPPLLQPIVTHHTGCPISKFPICFCHFLGFWNKYRGTSDLYSTALEICYMIGTRILKIDLEIAEIIEVKVGNHQLQIYILLLHRGRKIISMLKLATLTSIISVISKSIFKILVPIM